MASIRYGELPDAVAGAGQVLVRVQAVAVNVVDTYLRSGRWRTEVRFPPPAVPAAAWCGSGELRGVRASGRDRARCAGRACSVDGRRVRGGDRSERRGRNLRGSGCGVGGCRCRRRDPRSARTGAAAGAGSDAGGGRGCERRPAGGHAGRPPQTRSAPRHDPAGGPRRGRGRAQRAGGSSRSPAGAGSGSICGRSMCMSFSCSVL